MSVLKKKASLCKAQNLREYLRTLSTATLETLYNHPATCLAVFRDLPELAKHYVMRLLFVEVPVTKDIVRSWVHSHAIVEHNEAESELTNLKIWSEKPVPGGLPGWLLRDFFRNNLKIALLGGGEKWEIEATKEDKEKHVKDIAALDAYATKRWEVILHYMVGTKEASDPKEGVSVVTKDTLIHSGLIKVDNNELGITADGFQFLLMDSSTQVWFFMLKYLETVERREGLKLTECLTFLFQLSFATLGQVYSTDNMTNNSKVFLQQLRDFGLVYQRKRKDSRFYPTRLAINLITGLRDLNLDVNKPGYAIVETNYRVYAYTDSPLQIALLALFTEMQYRFSGLCLGTLTRESVRQALRSGITAEQIINFLSINAHPTLTGHPNPVPPTIIDQIRLWEIERDRFIFQEGVLYSQFLSQSDFELLRNYARDNGWLVWENPSKRSMVVALSSHEEVRAFWKRHKKEAKRK